MSTLEAHRQTVHKLALVDGYGGACCGVIAQLARRRQRLLHITLADVYAGAGQHRSAADPDGVSKGTALIFSTIARNIQRVHPLVQVHVRLNDLDADVASRLNRRVEHYRQGSTPSDRVDVTVTAGDASDVIVRIAREAAALGGFSVLLIDPFGMPPDFAVLDAAARGAGWHEMIINLDVSDLFRLSLVAQMEVAGHAALSAGDERRLDRIFGNGSWRSEYGASRAWTPDALAALARSYADRFAGGYAVRDVYRLWSTRNQIRFMIHLAGSPKARAVFAKCYERTQHAGLFQGKRLNDADRATYAFELSARLAGSATTLEEVAAAGLVPLDRGRLRDVFRTAEDRGLGELKEDVMIWFSKRRVPEAFKPAQLDFGLGA